MDFCARSPTTMQTLATFRKVIPGMPHKNAFGSNGVPRGRGTISVGDIVHVSRATNDGSVPLR